MHSLWRIKNRKFVSFSNKIEHVPSSSVPPADASELLPLVSNWIDSCLSPLAKLYLALDEDDGALVHEAPFCATPPVAASTAVECWGVAAAELDSGDI